MEELKRRPESQFEKDLSIDKFMLDEECVTHPLLYYRYCESAAEAKNDVSVLSDALKLKTGEANIDIRNSFIDRGIKFTEAVIASEIERDQGIINAKEELRDAELKYSHWQAAVGAFEHRKSQLDNLVKLYCTGYFSRNKDAGTDTAIKKKLNEKNTGVSNGN